MAAPGGSAGRCSGRPPVGDFTGSTPSRSWPRSRPLEVLQLVTEGLSNEETARRLVLSLPTIKWHTSNIYGKLGVSSRTQAVAKARTLGLLPAS